MNRYAKFAAKRSVWHAAIHLIWGVISLTVIQPLKRSCPLKNQVAEQHQKEQLNRTNRQLGVAEAFAKSVKYNRESNRYKCLTAAVTQYLVEEMVPLNRVEKPAFKSMLQKFDKQYELPGKTYFSETAVPKMYNTVKTSIKMELMNVDYFSATTDMWSSVNMTPYMSLTVHYLSMEWTLKTRCLETVFMPENHTSDNISDALRHAFEEWSLDEKKLACITTDNGANIVAAVKKLNWPWLNCFGHNLAVTKQFIWAKQFIWQLQTQALRTALLAQWACVTPWSVHFLRAGWREGIWPKHKQNFKSLNMASYW